MYQQIVSPKRAAVILGGTMLTLLLASLDNTIVSTAMPKIIRDLKGIEYYSWPFTAYLLFSTSIIPIAGKLADINGRKIIALAGIAVFISASALCGLSQNMAQLIIFRGLQGIGGGIMISNSFILVAEIYPPRERSKYTGILSSMFAVSSILGPAVGGFITDSLSWHWVFYINLPLGFLAFAVLLISIPNLGRNDENRNIDITGVIAFLLAVFPLLIGLSEGGKDFAWSSMPIIGLFIFSIIMFIVFFIIESRSKEPILSLHLFKNGIFAVSTVDAFLANAILFGAIMFIPLFAQSVLGSSATASGMITTPMMLGSPLGGIITGFLISKTRRFKIIGIISFLFAGTGMFLLSRMPSGVAAWEFMGDAFLLGCGIGMTYPLLTNAPQNVFPMSQLGMVTSAVQFFRNLGGTVSSAVLGTIMLSRAGANLKGLQLGKVPPQFQDLIKDPRLLIDPSAVEKIRSRVPSSFIDQFNIMISQAKDILASSIKLVFLICVFIAAAGLLIILFLNEKEVREGMDKHHR